VNNVSDGGWRTQISEESHLGLYVLVPHWVSFLNKFVMQCSVAGYRY